MEDSKEKLLHGYQKTYSGRRTKLEEKAQNQELLDSIKKLDASINKLIIALNNKK